MASDEELLLERLPDQGFRGKGQLGDRSPRPHVSGPRASGGRTLSRSRRSLLVGRFGAVAAGRDDNDRHLGELLVKPQLAADLEAADVGQADVEQDQVKGSRGDQFQALGAAGRVKQFVTLAAQDRLQGFADKGIVVDD